MPWHRPQFRPIHLILLVAIVAVELAILPGAVSAGGVGLLIVTAILAAVTGPLTKWEWAIIVMIHVILIALLLPAVQASRPQR